VKKNNFNQSARLDPFFFKKKIIQSAALPASFLGSGKKNSWMPEKKMWGEKIVK
jgi:hypothetical protein